MIQYMQRAHAAGEKPRGKARGQTRRPLHILYHTHPSQSIICPCKRRSPLSPLPHHPRRRPRRHPRRHPPWRSTYRGRNPLVAAQYLTQRSSIANQGPCCTKKRKYRWRALAYFSFLYVCTPYIQESKKLQVLIINKEVHKSLVRKNGNEIIVWSWNKPGTT